MKILFVNSNLGVLAKSWRSKHSFAIEILSAVLKKSDFQTDLFLVEKIKDIENLLTYIQKTKPCIIGFSLTEVNFGGIKAIAKKIKEKFPKIFIVIGGIYPTLFPQEVIKFSFLDAICIGEGEYSLLSLVKRIQQKKNYFDIENFWFRKGKKIIKNKRTPPVDINLLPMPDKQLFYEKNLGYYRGWFFGKEKEKAGFILLSRGCPFDCNFCANRAIKNLYGSSCFRLLSPEKAVSQIAYFQKRYRYDYLFIHDDIFAINKNWLDKFLKLYAKKIKLPFAVQLRIGTFNLKILKKLKKTSCFFVGLGIESGDEEIRKDILNKNFTNKQIKKSIGWLKKLNFKIASYNMIGLPGETPKDFLRTIKLNAELKIDRLHLSIFYPYKGTMLYNLCREQKLIRKKIPKNFNKKEDTILKLKDFKRKDILYLFENFHLLINLWRGNKLVYKLYSIVPSSRFFKISQSLGRTLVKVFSLDLVKMKS